MKHPGEILILLLLFSGCTDSEQALQQSAGTTPVTPIVLHQGDVTLTLSEPPLTIGEEPMMLSGLPASDEPPQITVRYVADNTPAPVEVTPLPQSGQDQIKAVFLLAGKWQLEMQPESTSASVRFILTVADSPEQTGME